MAFPHNSIRDFMDDCEKVGELAKIKEEVDWNLEAGAITRRAMEMSNGRSVKDGGQPAILFENVRGYPEGFSILGNIATNFKQAAMIFGHPNPDKANVREIQDLVIEGMANPIKPVLVKDGPCKENKAFGDDCNLYMFPAPMIHEGDGGRYMCTYHSIVTKDKTSDWINWGMYRAMIHDKRSLGVLFIHGQQGPNHYYDQYEQDNEVMPCAISINADPLSSFSAAAPIPEGISEMDVVGGWRKKPLEVVKCETSDLLVPASSEIVIEGVVPPRIRAYEGPFGEYTGFRASPRDRRPVFVVKCITWRSNPVMGMSNMGMPVSESHMINTLTKGALYRKALLDAGWPVVDVHVPLESTDLIVVSVKSGRPKIAQGVMGVILNSPCAIYTHKVIVCNEDVDVFNISEVVTAFVEKVHPEKGVTVYHHQGNPLAPFADLTERLEQTGPQMLIDATWPLNWPPEIAVPPCASFTGIYPKELQEKVLSKWTKYGLK
ncbi:UbiD family decarboxylase [Chloroflexota bacterium]